VYNLKCKVFKFYFESRFLTLLELLALNNEPTFVENNMFLF